jgi:hypothetical protein
MTRTSLLLVLSTVMAACTVGADPGAAPATTGPAGTGDGGALTALPSATIIVLPPADRLADAERDRIRLMVERVAVETLPGDPAPVVLAPATTAAFAATVESAVRRVGPAGTVCLLGADVDAVAAEMAALYPATRICRLPAGEVPVGVVGGSRPAAGPASPLQVDIDPGRLGRALGTAARAAAVAGDAGDATVLVLSGGDPMLDRRWSDGVAAGAAGSVHKVARASEALELLDAQAESLAAGVVPGGPDVFARESGGPLVGSPDRDDLPLALTLPPITAVVLDASPEAALLVGALLERGLLVVGPRSLLSGQADGSSDATVVLRWRVRWDVPLAALLRRAGAASGAADAPAVIEPAWDDMVVLEPGPAHVAP